MKIIKKTNTGIITTDTLILDSMKNEELLEWIEMWRANCKYVEAFQRGLCGDCPVNEKCKHVYQEIEEKLKKNKKGE